VRNVNSSLKSCTGCLLLLLLVVTPLYRACSESTSKVKVGVVIALTGGLASVGEGIKNGTLLAKSDFDSKDQVEFLFEDDAFQPAKTVSAVQKLLTIDKVRALVSFGSSTGLAIVPMAETAKVPLFAISGEKCVSQGKHSVIRHFVNVTDCSRDIAAEVKRRGYQRVFVAATTQDAMLEFKNLFAAQFGALVVGQEEFEHGTRDFYATATRAVGLKADAIYLLLLAPQASMFAKQARTVGYKGDFFGGFQLENRVELQSAGDALRDAWFASTIAGVQPGFLEHYRRNFNIPMEHNAPYGYDIAKIIIESVQKNADINAYAHQLKDFSGVLGTYGITPDNDFSVPSGINIAAELLRY
jgi:branched-chain amino acid transport system substrate-binding protein